MIKNTHLIRLFAVVRIMQTEARRWMTSNHRLKKQKTGIITVVLCLLKSEKGECH